MKSAYKCFIYFLVLISTVSCKKEIIKENIVGKWKIHPNSITLGKHYHEAPNWLGKNDSHLEFLDDGTFKSNHVFGRFTMKDQTITFFVDSASSWVKNPGNSSGLDELHPGEIISGKTLSIKKIKPKRIIFQGATTSAGGLAGGSDEGQLYRYKRIK